MNRRSFLGKAIGVIGAAIAALPAMKGLAVKRDHYKVEWGPQFGSAGHSPEAMAEIVVADKVARGDPGGRWIRFITLRNSSFRLSDSQTSIDCAPSSEIRLKRGLWCGGLGR